jgi:hypothetical protein
MLLVDFFEEKWKKREDCEGERVSREGEGERGRKIRFLV